MKKILSIVIFIFAIISLTPAIVLAQTSASSTEPIIQTFKTATSTAIYMTLPEGFNGAVTTTYDNGEFKTTYATSSTEVSAEFQKLQSQMEAEQQAMNQIFQDQQKLFDQIWGHSWWN